MRSNNIFNHTFYYETKCLLNLMNASLKEGHRQIKEDDIAY